MSKSSDDFLISIGAASQAFLDANARLIIAYYSALETIEHIGLGRFYVMRWQLDNIRNKAENELYEEFPPDRGKVE